MQVLAFRILARMSNPFTFVLYGPLKLIRTATKSLSDARKVRDTALAARPMAVPEVINAVPLVEFIFYYKGRGKSYLPELPPDLPNSSS